MGPVSTPAAVLSLRDLKFRWPRASHDLIDIEALDVQPGETLFMHGPSGCGKSTLLSLLAGVLTASSGEVMLLGTDWGRLASAQRDHHRAGHVGYIFQQFNLLPYLLVTDNVRLPCRFSTRRAARASACESAEHLLERLRSGHGALENAARWSSRSDSSSGSRPRAPSSASPNSSSPMTGRRPSMSPCVRRLCGCSCSRAQPPAARSSSSVTMRVWQNTLRDRSICRD